jgi:hypothetical protein
MDMCLNDGLYNCKLLCFENDFIIFGGFTENMEFNKKI